MNLLQKDVIISPFEFEYWDGGRLEASVGRANIAYSKDDVIKNFWRKYVTIVSESYKENWDENGDFAGWSDETDDVVIIEFDAEEAEAFARWLLDAAKEIRSYGERPRAFYKNGKLIWDNNKEDNSLDQEIERWEAEGGSVDTGN